MIDVEIVAAAAPLTVDGVVPGPPGPPGPPGAALPLGGVTGQYLVKASDDDLDMEWRDAGSGGSVPDATTTTKGKVRLAGDLAGTADAPTVPGLAEKQPVGDYATRAELPDVSGLATTAYVDQTVGDIDTVLSGILGGE